MIVRLKFSSNRNSRTTRTCSWTCSVFLGHSPENDGYPPGSREINLPIMRRSNGKLMPQKKESPVKRHLVLFVLGFALVQALSPAALAERKPYALDRPHCQLNFIGEALLISAHGYFDKWDAEVQLDRDKL